MRILKNSKKNQDNVTPGVSISGAYASEELTKNLKEATKRVFHDSEKLTEVIEQYKRTDTSQLQGRAFEFIESLKFNSEAAEARRNDLSANPTHFDDPQSPSDINIYQDNKLVREVQAKSRENHVAALRDLTKNKYDDMGKLVPKEQEEPIKNLIAKRLENAPPDQPNRAQYEDVDKNLMGSLKHGDISSPGTSRPEAEFAANHPELAKMYYDGEAVLKEVGVNSAYGGGISAGSALVMKGLLESSKVIRGKRNISDSISDTLACTASAAVRGSAVSAGSAGIRIVVSNTASEGARTFAQGAGPIAIANSIYEMGYAVRKYTKGEIGKDEFKEECGSAALKGVSTYYCGVVGQILIPVPVLGAMVGSLVGYTTSSMLVQSGILGVGPKNIVAASRKRRKEIEKECYKAIEEMVRYRNMFNEINSLYQLQYEKELLPNIERFNESMIRWSPQEMIDSLSSINSVFSKTLQFRSFEEFDEFMEDESSHLTI